MHRTAQHKPHPKQECYEGIISLTARGVGFFTLPETEEEIRIEREHIHTALHNDYVAICLRPEIKYEKRTGEVKRIITRAKEDFVGTLSSEGGRYFVVPQDRRMYTSIALSPREAEKASIGDKVLVRMLPWEAPSKEPSGEIREVIGKKGVHETEMRALALDRGIDLSFPPQVVKEAEEERRNHAETLANEVPKRRDMRGVPLFTIDPKTAKDFDDALSVEKLPEEGLFRIGIHIADVSAFVKSGTALDAEAAKRSNSIYLVDRTIPMLPHPLSTDICSLNPDEDRLAFSVILDMSEDGDIKRHWFGKTIIHSEKRFTYEEAQEVLNEGRGIFH
ncbi:MAG: RNB domain-containing ribonuclease, partial [Patescibacteria group bacterium]